MQMSEINFSPTDENYKNNLKAKSHSYNGTIRINLRLGQQIHCLSLWYLQNSAGFQEVQGICT